MKIETGTIVLTAGVNAVFQEDKQFATFVTRSLARHTKGDWGELTPEDVEMNEDALLHGGRLFSAYNLDDKTKIWIITEADRSVTTVLFPSEY